MTLVYPKDWTEQGVTKLSLWFQGAATNSADKMYIALNGTAIVYHDNPAATQSKGWNEWVIDRNPGPMLIARYRPRLFLGRLRAGCRASLAGRPQRCVKTDR